jgi:hypothetical protein
VSSRLTRSSLLLASPFGFSFKRAQYTEEVKHLHYSVMFVNVVRSRKRGRKALADGADADAARPLRDVVACLTGFPSEEKERIHRLIQELGGRYVNSCARIETE